MSDVRAERLPCLSDDDIVVLCSSVLGGLIMHLADVEELAGDPPSPERLAERLAPLGFS